MTALNYSGAARDLILLYKFGPEGGRMLLARPLAALMATAVRLSGIGLDVDLVTAVPSHPRRVLERGFDAAHLLARRLRRPAGLPAPRALLTRIGGDAPRARGPHGRSMLPEPEFRLRRRAKGRVQGRRVLLVDDVFTTGTTLRRCCRLLSAAGAAEVRSVVLARTPRRPFDRAVPIV